MLVNDGTERERGDLACAFHPGGTLLLRSRGILQTCRVWERLEPRSQSSPDQWSQTLTGCFPTGDSTHGFCLAFQIAVCPQDDRPELDQPPLTAVLKILADCKPDCLALPKVQLVTRARARGQSTWLQVVETECSLAKTRRTVLRVHVAQPVNLISFRLNIQSLAPVCTVCISAISMLIPAPPMLSKRRSVKMLPSRFQPWLAIIQFVNLETVLKLSATCRHLRQVVDTTFAGTGGIISRFVKWHSLDIRQDVRESANPIEDCTVFALEDQLLFKSERAFFANLLLNTFTFICDIFTQPNLPMQLFYGARHEKISSGPSLTFETWVDDEAKHTIQLIVITPLPPIKIACNISLQMRLLL